MNKTDPGITAFWQDEPAHWLQELSSSAQGLTAQQAAERMVNAAAKQSHSKRDLLLLLGQFKSPLMLLLIGAVILSGVLGDTSDVFIIGFIVLSTGFVGFLQERNAGRVVEKLQSLIALNAAVIRDGKTISVPATTVVPGDIICFSAGDRIPADCLLLEANELHANEASLTGESYPVRKVPGALSATTELAKRSNCLWEGTNIVSGSARAIAIHTGSETIFGGIAVSAAATVETTFEKGIRDFGYFLMKITLVLSVFILVVNLLNHKSVIESALFALALAVGMAPELLPAITTIAMSAGARRMLEKKVIVKKLTSIQNLGEVNLLCTDKTGTITEGAISVAGMVDAEGNPSEMVKKMGAWNARLESGYSNPIDEALKRIELKEDIPVTRTGEVPYDFVRKRLSIGVDTGKEKWLISKGAFTQIAAICSKVQLADGTIRPFPERADAINKQFEGFGNKGFRAIGICYKPIGDEPVSKDLETDMIFTGFILLQDPVKAGIHETIAELASLQVGIKIITGDNKNVARSIASGLGISDPVVLTGPELLTTSSEALVRKVQEVHIFAEVEPQQKERIIRALRHSYTVAYMGDGINDVSAITAADVGISVENAVDVAREAADFVLMEKDLRVLADGIREGRKTFANTLKYIFINTGSTFGNMFSVAVASLLLPFLPMLPKQILLTNFITDFPYLTVASDNVDPEQIARPGKWNLKFIRQYMIIFGIHSSLFDVLTFFTLLYVLKVKESAFQTGWFIESILTELFILFIIRTHRNFFKSKPGKYLFLLSVLGLILTLVLPYLPFAPQVGLVPLPFSSLLILLAIVGAYILTADLLKVWFFRRFREQG